jgi:hypothetical protein
MSQPDKIDTYMHIYVHMSSYIYTYIQILYMYTYSYSYKFTYTYLQGVNAVLFTAGQEEPAGQDRQLSAPLRGE